MTESARDRPANPQHQSAEPESAGAVNFGRVLAYFLKLGAIGFGGPIASVGYMQRDLVEQRRWIDRQDFLDGVALGQTMPGPLAAQVAMWVGYLRRGALGAAAVAAAFVAPAFAIVVAVGAIYSHYSGSRVVQALFYGIAPAVMAIITIAAINLIKLTDRRDWRLWTISTAVFALTAFTGSEPVLVIVGAGVLMILLDARPRIRLRHRKSGDHVAKPDDNPKRMPLVIGLGMIAGGGTLAALAWFFLKTGAIVFGSGLAIVPFMRAGVVDQHHWLTNSQFLDSVAIGLITPGPVVISAGFIGYLVAGLPGAIVSSVAIFTPIYLGVVVPGHWFLRHRDNAQVRAFVAGATSAAGGALCGAVVVLTRQAVTDWMTATIAVVTLGLLWRFKIKEPYVVLVTGVLGLLVF
ncbi:chromate efflux transporter [Mycobacterium simiae]|uniref:chromate efflux transporter n=1 Tax=Mycobacterium simiae TaxID=1784 RepID=UPI000401FBC2|nr:chromate efflux transporter [Mycobacterium simiae]PLV47539.1 chromate transporter [Mycobacterium tuberculosis variant microti OV254]BBX41673.1 chromate resistance transporter [Mycobacterium simiae]